jgi:transposase InsO family protein
MVSPARRRAAVHYLVRRHKISERRACKVVGQNRSTQRYEGVPGDYEMALVKAMNRIAATHPRWGYRTVWAMLRSEGWQINRKRIERLWRLEGHRVPPRRKKQGKKGQGHDGNAIWNLPAAHPNHIWSYDFMATRLRNGASIRILNVVDEYTRVVIGAHVDRTIGSADVIAQLEQLFKTAGKPEFIRSDNGREFIATSVGIWLAEHGVKTAFVEKGSPQQNAFVERFNGTMRNELLDREEFDTLTEARVMVARWTSEYNRHRPHRGLGFKTPYAYADEARKELASVRSKVRT